MQIDVVRKRIDKLREQIRYYNDQFFTHARSLISDYAYDQLVKELKMLEGNHPDLITADSPTQQIGESVDIVIDLNQPALDGLANDAYKFFVEVDEQNAIAEGDEDNNTAINGSADFNIIDPIV